LIQKLLIFENSGICLYSKEYCPIKSLEDDELTTGFLAVLFGYLDSKFGNMNRITTQDTLFLVRKVQGIYITLIISRITKRNQQEEDVEEHFLLTKRLEQTCNTHLGLIERKVGTLLLKLQLRRENIINYKNLFAEIDHQLDEIVAHCKSKIESIRKLLNNRSISNLLEIY
jgi:hypothetical protein